MQQPKTELVVAFAGNPNVGKTALINSLAKSKLKVGNWPGVTVEKKEALFTYQDINIRLIDLPGTYSLTPHSIEERVCRDFLVNTPPDLIVNVIDTSNIERNLFLTSQLQELNTPMILALNMWDEFEDRGYLLDIASLESNLGIKAIPTVGPAQKGTEELLDAIIEQCGKRPIPHHLSFEKLVEDEVQTCITAIELELYAKGVSHRWLALRLLEFDQYTIENIKNNFGINLSPWLKERKTQLEKGLQKKLSTYFSDIRNQYITTTLNQALKKPTTKKIELTDRIDKLFLHPLLGIPVFWGILYLVFKITFDLSGPFIDWVDGFINGFIIKWATISLEALSLPTFMISLITEGLIGGVGLVLTFVPLLICLYLLLALLEESGYMARAAFLMDRFMAKIGLHGKAFLPLLVGLGCNVPGVYASRALDNETDRKLTISVLSFFSCGAKLPIYALFTAVFFQKNQALIIFLMYLIGVVVAIFWAAILRKTAYYQAPPVFIMELPPYRFPSFKLLWASIWVKTRSFIQDAGTVIAVTMILLWCLINLPYGAPTEDTLLAKSAKTLAPVFQLQGFGQNWEPVAAVIPGFVAKEVVVGTLAVIMKTEEIEDAKTDSGFFQDIYQQIIALKDATFNALKTIVSSIIPSTFEIEQSEESSLFKAIREKFTPLTAFSYMVFNLLLLSCVAVMGAIVQEFNFKQLAYTFALTLGTAYVISGVVYQGGSLLGYV